jgi:hypothetical protein
MGERIQPAAADQLADLAVHDVQSGGHDTPVQPVDTSTKVPGL